MSSINTNANVFYFDTGKTLTSIVIPNSITNIDDYSFYGAVSLVSVVIDNDLRNITGGIFCFLRIPENAVFKVNNTIAEMQQMYSHIYNWFST